MIEGTIRLGSCSPSNSVGYPTLLARLPPPACRAATIIKVERMQPKASSRPVVLVVEDEILLRMDAIDALEAAGYDVLDAGNADEAIAMLKVRGDIHVIFTDIDMPGSMDGLKLAHFVRDRWPPVKIIATSGLAHVAEKNLPEGGRFLHKPYTPTQVIATIDQLMNG